jgi:hypothetical protein
VEIKGLSWLRYNNPLLFPLLAPSFLSLYPFFNLPFITVLLPLSSCFHSSSSLRPLLVLLFLSLHLFLSLYMVKPYLHSLIRLNGAMPTRGDNFTFTSLSSILTAQLRVQAREGLMLCCGSGPYFRQFRRLSREQYFGDLTDLYAVPFVITTQKFKENLKLYKRYSSRRYLAVENLCTLRLSMPGRTCFHSGFLFSLFFNPEDGGDMFLRNVDLLSTDYTALYPRR